MCVCATSHVSARVKQKGEMGDTSRQTDRESKEFQRLWRRLWLGWKQSRCVTDTDRGWTKSGHLTFPSWLSGRWLCQTISELTQVVQPRPLWLGRREKEKKKKKRAHNRNTHLVSSAHLTSIPSDSETLCPAVCGITVTTAHPSSPSFPPQPPHTPPLRLLYVCVMCRDRTHPPPPKLLYLMNTPLK